MPSFFRFATLLLFALVHSIPAQAQELEYNLGQKFTPEDLREDFATFRNHLVTQHIGLDRYSSLEEIIASMDEIESELTQDLNALEFFNKLTRLNELIGNNHTAFSPPKETWDAIKKDLPQFPIEVYWDRSSLFVLENNSGDQSISEGSKILSINGRHAEELFTEMAQSIRRDGKNLSYPYKRSAISFGIIYASRIEMSETFELEILSPSGESKRHNIDALTPNQIKANKADRSQHDTPENSALPLGFKIENDIAMLKVASFSTAITKKAGQNWKKFYQNAFKKIYDKKVDKLIIDIRGNNGGQPEPPIALMRYLAAEPFKVYRSMTASVEKVIEPNLYEQNGAIEYFEDQKWKKKDGHFFLDDNDYYKTYKSEKRAFQGELVVLIDALTNSSAGTFAGQVKNETGAVFIGDETGGNPNETVAHFIANLELPNTKVHIRVPLVLSVKEVKFENTGRGVIPDYAILPSIEDMLTGRDLILEKAKQLLAQ